MNIFWIGLIIIIIFLLYQYRNLEIKYEGLIKDNDINIDRKKIVNKIHKIETELNKIKKEINNE